MSNGSLPSLDVIGECLDRIDADVDALNADTVRRAYANNRSPLPKMLVQHEQRELERTMNESSEGPDPKGPRRRM